MDCAYHDDEGAAFSYHTVTGPSFEGHGLLIAISTALTVVGGAVDVYDGTSAQGRLVWSSRDPSNLGTSAQFVPPRGIGIERGIWVVCLGAIVTVVFKPVAYLRQQLK